MASSPRSDGRWRSAAVLLLLALLFLLGVLAVRFVPAWLADPEGVRTFLLGFGVLAPVAFVVAQAVQVVVAPIPGQVLVFAAGYLFGAVWGTLLSLVGATIGTYVAVRLARRFGRPAVERLVRAETLVRFDAAIDHRGLLALFLVFLIPGLPDDAICLLAGLTRLDVRRVLVVSAVGRLPGYAIAALAGDRLATGHAADTVVLVGLLLAISVLVYAARHPIDRWLAGEPGRGRG